MGRETAQSVQGPLAAGLGKITHKKKTKFTDKKIRLKKKMKTTFDVRSTSALISRCAHPTTAQHPDTAYRRWTSPLPNIVHRRDKKAFNYREPRENNLLPVYRVDYQLPQGIYRNSPMGNSKLQSTAASCEQLYSILDQSSN